MTSLTLMEKSGWGLVRNSGGGPPHSTMRNLQDDSFIGNGGMITKTDSGNADSTFWAKKFARRFFDEAIGQDGSANGASQ